MAAVKGTKRRWIFLGWASAVGAGLNLLLFAAVPEWFGAFLRLPCWIVTVGVLTVLVAIGRQGVGRWGAFSGVRHLATYPPLWVAGFLGASAVMVAVAWFSPVREAFGLVDNDAEVLRRVALGLLIAVVLLGIGVLIALWHRHPSDQSSQISAKESSPGALPEDSEKATPSSAPWSSFDALIEWLKDDDPVEGPDKDAFGHAAIAERIANRLLNDEPIPSQAVVGALGSGKSTVGNLVGEALERRQGKTKRIELVTVELWPYQTSRAAVEGVIQRLIDVLAKEVNVISVRGLPAEYATAMSAGGGFWSVLSGTLSPTRSPWDLLDQIDAIATAIGRTYVVWVEDLERFASQISKGGQQSRASDWRDEPDRLNPIRALLHGLDRLGSVSVITATTALHQRFDIDKIARYVEAIPRLPLAKVAQVITMFRNGHHRGADYIDPEKPDVRKLLDSSSFDVIDHLRHVLTHSPVGASHALIHLCATPRALKQGLRSAKDTWNLLKGEIDFDDMLVMSILRTSQPDVFALVEENIDALRAHAGNQEKRKDARLRVHEDIQKLNLSEFFIQAIWKLFDYVFGEDQGGPVKLQGMSEHSHADYWLRFLSPRLLPEAERDQPVLRALRQDNDEEILGLLENPQRSMSVLDFAELLDDERIFSLFLPLIRRRVSENPSTWTDGSPPGLVSLAIMWRKRPRTWALKKQKVFTELLESFDLSVPLNLQLALKIEGYFVLRSEGASPILSEVDGRNAKKKLRETALEEYKGRSDILARALSGAETYTLYGLCRGLEIPSKTQGVWPAWHELVPTIYDAASRSPEVILPQIAGLVTKRAELLLDNNDRTHGYEFDPDAAAELFGSEARVLELFRVDIRDKVSDKGQLEAVYRAVPSTVSTRH